MEYDASKFAVGGVLQKIGKDNQLHVISYFSKALTKSQRNWSPTEKECFASLLATRKWEVYLIPRPITLISDASKFAVGGVFYSK